MGGKLRPLSRDPLVSVVVVSHNRAGYLRDCFESLLSQSYAQVKVFFVDDASTDATAKIFRKYRRPGWTYIKNRSVLGPGVSRQKALERCRKGLVAFLDSDDRWHPRKLEKQVALFRAHPLVLCHTRRYWINRSGRPCSLPPRQKKFRARSSRFFGGLSVWWKAYWPLPFPCTSSVLVRAESLHRVGGVDKRFRFLLDDKDLWLRVVKEYGIKGVRFINAPLVGYRLHATQTSLPGLVGLFGHEAKPWVSAGNFEREILMDFVWFQKKWLRRF